MVTVTFEIGIKANVGDFSGHNQNMNFPSTVVFIFLNVVWKKKIFLYNLFIYIFWVCIVKSIFMWIALFIHDRNSIASHSVPHISMKAI